MIAHWINNKYLPSFSNNWSNCTPGYCDTFYLNCFFFPITTQCCCSVVGVSNSFSFEGHTLLWSKDTKSYSMTSMHVLWAARKMNNCPFFLHLSTYQGHLRCADIYMYSSFIFLSGSKQDLKDVSAGTWLLNLCNSEKRSCLCLRLCSALLPAVMSYQREYNSWNHGLYKMSPDQTLWSTTCVMIGFQIKHLIIYYSSDIHYFVSKCTWISVEYVGFNVNKLYLILLFTWFKAENWGLMEFRNDAYRLGLGRVGFFWYRMQLYDTAQYWCCKFWGSMHVGTKPHFARHSISVTCLTGLPEENHAFITRTLWHV